MKDELHALSRLTEFCVSSNSELILYVWKAVFYSLSELMVRNIPANRNKFSTGTTSIARSVCK
jgi:hypothetical protein